MGGLRAWRLVFFAAIAAGALSGPAAAEPSPAVPDAAKVELHWGVKVPLRDGVRLNATVYTPKGQSRPAPCVLTLTPYIGDTYHDRGVYFAAHGLVFAVVDSRGRGNSEGVFRPFIQEARDGRDVVEWLARQPYCNGKVAMAGGSYTGYDQWAVAKERPPHLATIVPTAAPYAGADFPFRNNIAPPYLMEWLAFTAGKALQSNIAADQVFWSQLLKARFERGEPFDSLEHTLSGDQPVLREWTAHPHAGPFWDAYNATPDQLRALDIPILTITGSYDDDQPGALAWYRSYMAVASPAQKARHYLVIGPWDHAGTHAPKPQVGGVKFGPASLVDIPRLHVAWYDWTLAGGPKPEFLKGAVAYYVMGADTWRYADSLDAVTAELRPFFLDSTANANRVEAPGALDPARPGEGAPDHYVYDPRDVSTGAIEAGVDPSSLVDQTMLLAQDGRELIYETKAFDKATELSGFFKLAAWIALDQPDTDFRVSVYEVSSSNESILLTTDQMRARYRESLRKASLVTTREPLAYTFDRFTFVSRQIAAGSRLRLVIAPINSINSEKNYNSGKAVAEETMRDARPVTVTLMHDKAHPSALYVPFGRPQGQ